MRSGGGFSFSSVILSYLMIAGGIAGALLGAMALHPPEVLLKVSPYLEFGIGALLGAFFAARASRGSTIVEPALGALLVIGTLGGLLLSTEIGQFMWQIGGDHATQFAAITSGAALVGALGGAFVSERLFGESTRSSLPWIFYVVLAVVGGCFLAAFAAFALTMRAAHSVGEAVGDTATGLLLGVIAAGCLLAGLAAGASARTRVLVASFLGAAIGVFGFFVLWMYFLQHRLDDNQWIGAAVLAVGGAIVCLIGAALGWAAVGRRQAG